MLTNHSNRPERLYVATSNTSGTRERSPAHQQSWRGNGAGSHLGLGTAGTWERQKEKRGSGEEGDREEGRGRMGKEEEKGKNREEPEQ